MAASKIASNQYYRKDELGQKKKVPKRAKNGVSTDSPSPFLNLKSFYSLGILTNQTIP